MSNPKNKRVLCWFSAGAASAVATKLALQQYPDALVLYQETNSEHPDNERFLRECSEWFGKDITKLSSDKYHDIWDVFEKTRYLVGPSGARCTSELKRSVAENFINFGKDIEVMGYTFEEQRRVQRFIQNNPERDLWPILVERELRKEDCLALIDKAGINLPVMYQQGFSNNNCIGCPKGGARYWKRIRHHYPEHYQRMSGVEKDLGISINRKQKKMLPKDVENDILEFYIKHFPNDDSDPALEDEIRETLISFNSVVEVLSKSEENSKFTLGKSTYRKLKNSDCWDRRTRVFLSELPDDVSEFPIVKSVQCGILCEEMEEDFFN